MILCCGEALIDMLPRKTETGEDCFAPHAGGSVFNTAIGLGRLDRKVGLVSGLSNDLFGQQLIETLSESRVDTNLTIRSDRTTTLAFVTLENGQARYAFYDEGTAGRMLEPDDMPAVPQECTAMFFGGISLVVEPCATAYEALMLRQASERLIMLDPNIRPSFIKDEPAYRARLDRMIVAADIVKLSDEDLHWLMGPGEIEGLAQQLVSMGPKLVCITKGADGVTGYMADSKAHAAAPRVKVVDTVGAGDTFNAGFLAGLDRIGVASKTEFARIGKDAITAALEYGVTAAAVTVSRAGANTPWLKEMP